MTAILDRPVLKAPLDPLRDDIDALRLSLRSKVMLTFAAIVGLLAFAWPLFLRPDAVLAGDRTGTSAAPFLMAAIMGVVLAVVVSELSGNDLDVKALAMLGVLAAVGAALRPLGAGTAGLETMFFLMILAGRVFGPGFGFVLGNLAMFASALITASVGTWLPYQMLATGFVALLAGCLPRRLARPGSGAEILLLSTFGFLCGFGYGYIMDFAFWPFTFGSGAGTQGGYDPTATPLHNLHTFLVVNTVTSLGWNLGRSLTNAVLIAVLGRPLLRIFRRTARTAQFR